MFINNGDVLIRISVEFCFMRKVSAVIHGGLIGVILARIVLFVTWNYFIRSVWKTIKIMKMCLSKQCVTRRHLRKASLETGKSNWNYLFNKLYFKIIILTILLRPSSVSLIIKQKESQFIIQWILTFRIIIFIYNKQLAAKNTILQILPNPHWVHLHVN